MTLAGGSGTAGTGGRAPLSLAQEQLWHFTQLAPGNPVYNEAFTVRKDGPLDLAALQSAFNEVVRRHGIWRSTFSVVDGEALQIVHAPTPVELPVLDLSSLPDKDREQEAARAVGDLARPPYDLARGPLLRPLLVRFTTGHHRLYVGLHHLVFDGVSLYSVVFPELVASYEAFAAGLPSPLIDPAPQYAEYAWSERMSQAADDHDRVDYWRTRLANAPALQLPVDHPRPPRQRFSGAMEPIHLSRDLAARLRAVSASGGATLFQTLATAFGVLLNRYSGQEDVVFGTVVDMRGRPELDRLVGYCVSPMAMRMDLSGNLTFAELLSRSQAKLLADLDHRLPFERVVRELQPPRDPGSNPIFQAALVMQRATAVPDPTWSVHLIEVEVGHAIGHAKFDLQFELDARPTGEVEGRLIYSTDLFEPATARRLAASWNALLQGIAADASVRIAELPVLTDAERRLQLVEWAGPTTLPPQPATLHGQVTAQAARSPHALAVTDGAESLSYADLEDRAGRLAHHLRDLGVHRDILVGVAMERSVDMMVALLAVLKAGGAYVPLEPDHPHQRLVMMLEDARPLAVLTTAGLIKALPGHVGHTVLVDADRDSWMGLAPLASDADDAEALAYVLYTSGSTGQPKGVMIEHRSIVNQLVWRVDSFGLGPSDRVLQKTPLGFDVSLWELFAPLISGGVVVLLEPGVHGDPVRIAGTIRAEGVTALHFVPSMLQTYLDTVGAETCESVRLVAASGERLSAALRDQFFSCFGRNVSLRNLYGPTEASVDATSWECVPGEPNVPIGRPVANTQVHILDAHLQLVPVGAPGELYIGGAGVARGYLNQPELTAERFLPDPFRPGDRMYRSGDRARLRYDGAVEYLGRDDDQVKIRGNRIELGEVEAAIGTHPRVRHAAVVARDDPSGDLRLIAYLVAPGIEPARLSTELRRHLAGRLPAVMVPAAFVTLHAAPLTASGKLDRRALPAPNWTPYASSAFVAPGTVTETRLASLWARIFGVERVGLHEDFFDLGGHSLQAVRLLTDVEREFGAAIGLTAMFESGRTVAALAALVDAAPNRLDDPPPMPDPAGPPTTPQVCPRGHDGPAPLSAAEAQIWYFTRLAPGNPVYNEAFTLVRRGEFNVSAFRQAINEVVRRHEILRSTFELVAGEPMQVVHAAPTLELPLIDLVGRSNEDCDEELARIASEDANQPYEVETGPLLRLRLIRTRPDRHVLHMSMHHLVFDAASLRIVLAELIILHEAFADGLPSPLPEVPIQYADFAEWEQEWTASAAFGARLEYWKQYLRGAQMLHLPLDRPRRGQQSFRGAAMQFEIPHGLADELRTLSRKESATLFQTMATAFSVLLHRHSRQEDVVFGTMADQRERPELRGMVGCCVTPLVVRCDVSGDPTFTALLKRVRAQLFESMRNQVPFDRLVRELQPPRERGANPIFQVVLAMQPHPNAADLSWEVRRIDEGIRGQAGQAKFDLTFDLEEQPQGHINCQLIYNTDILDGETVGRLADQWLRLLEGIVAKPALPVSQLPLLADSERDLQLVEWNATTAPLPERCVHHLVSEQAARSPSATAVSDGRTEVTYEDLELRASRLAAHLGHLGIGAEQLVGISMQRSIDLVVALLAVLKVGAAFVPLEPEQPPERLALMFAEARPALILTTTHDSAAVDGLATPLLRLDAERDRWMSATPAAAGRGGPADLAYVLFTSGSTGIPKGVMVEHRSLVNQLLWMSGSFRLSTGDRVLQRTPLSFDVSLAELFSPLVAGAAIALLPPGDNADVRRLRESVTQQRATVVSFVPSLLEEFLDAGAAAGCSSVRLVTVGGETVSAALVRRVMQAFGPAVEVRNMYGPTEAVVTATWWRCEGEEEPPPIGYPVANTQVYVLDDRLQPLPIGARGELCIGGVQVARGYLNQVELTAERFVANPFRPGERIYRTGDTVRYRRDGAIMYVGRDDSQVKIRGVRIELGEVEAALAACRQVKQGVAAVRHDAEGNSRLVAYIVPTATATVPTVAELRAALAHRLPPSMLPSAVVALESIPLNQHGKVTRAALPEPQWKSATRFHEPRTVTEKRLADIWARTLRVGRVGLDDDFFELGGHSLLAVRLLSKVEVEMGAVIPLTVFFGAGATVANMAAAVDATLGIPDAPSSAGNDGSLALQVHGSEPCLFFIHADESSMLTLRHFMGPLGPERRVLGMLPERVGRRFDRSRSVEDLAEPMLRTIRETQPQGPYFIAGYSFGGLLAYQIASRLRGLEEEVAWLALLDCPSSTMGAQATRRRLSMRERLARQRRRGLSGALRKTTEVARRELIAGLGRLNVWPRQLTDDFDWRGAAHIARRYATRGNDAPMDLFRTATAMEYNESESLGWENVHRGTLRVHEVPGEHLTMVTEPHVTILAEMVTRSLRRAQLGGEVLP